MIALLLAVALGGHEAPVVETKSVVPEKQAVLAEMWQRRILPTDSTSWSPEDMALLARIRSAEKLGALALLRKRYGSLKPFTVIHKGTTRLTKPGYDKYLFTKSQEALRWFELREIEAKWALQLKNEDGKPLFDGAGQLTDAGDVLYTRMLHNLPTYWVLPNGEKQGNRPPKRP